MARREQADGAGEASRRLDPEGHYSPEDLVVTAREDLPGEGLGRLSDQLPAREIVYRLARAHSRITLADLAQEFVGAVPGGARPPYAQEPAVYVLRLLAGSRADLPPLATVETLLRLIAADPDPDPDYGFLVRPG